MTEPTSQPDSPDKKQRNRGTPGIHRLPLRTAMELVGAVYELGQGEPVLRTFALDHIDRSPTSGTSATLVAAANTYGLIRASGERLETTERGRRLLGTEGDDTAKQRAALDAIRSIDSNVFCIERYEDKPLPTDEVVIDSLKQTQGLPDNDAKIVWNMLKTNLNEYGFLKELANGKKMIRLPELIESAPKTNAVSEVSEGNTQTGATQTTRSTLPISPVVPMSGSQSLAPEFHFNIQVHLPSDAKPEQYDAIFASIAKHLLGRKD